MNFDIVNPSSTEELLAAMHEVRNKNFRFGAGCTDLLLELRKNPEKDLMVINLAGVRDQQFKDIQESPSGLRLGAGVTAHQIITHDAIKIRYPVLYESAYNLASTQIRQVATVGGNVCTASPSGDIACALVALEAECELINTAGEKRNLRIDEFFTGVRKTALQKNEVLAGISLTSNSKNAKNIHSGFIKIGTRRSMECSVASIAFHIQSNNSGEIIKAGVAVGASAPTIRFATEACDFLLGRNSSLISAIEIDEYANLVLSYADPISDLRASAWYRKEVLFNISKSILENIV